MSRAAPRTQPPGRKGAHRADALYYSGIQLATFECMLTFPRRITRAHAARIGSQSHAAAPIRLTPAPVFVILPARIFPCFFFFSFALFRRRRELLCLFPFPRFAINPSVIAPAWQPVFAGFVLLLISGRGDVWLGEIRFAGYTAGGASREFVCSYYLFSGIILLVIVIWCLFDPNSACIL